MHVTSGAADAALRAARAKATELNTQMCISIIDSGANSKVFFRMDDAWVGSINISQKKAKTAVLFGSSVENDQAVTQAGVDVLGVNTLPEHP